MACSNPTVNRMDAIVATRYTPLVLPQLVNSLPLGDYLKYIRDNQSIENEDVWMRVFVQILFGEARKWFRVLAPGSITGIEVPDEAFLRH
jgi:hypothetical protein